MPWGYAAAAGAGIIGSSMAADAQKDAAGSASALSQAQWNDTVRRNAPYEALGTGGIQTLNRMLPDLLKKYDPLQALQDPSYQFGLDQGQKTLERSLASQGMGDSGAALKAAARFGTDYATTKTNDAFARDQASKSQTYSILQGLIGTGQASANNTAAQGMNMATNVGANMIGAGDASAAGILSGSNQIQNLINQGTSAYGRRGNGGGGSGTDFGWSGSNVGGYEEQPGDQGQYFADGGPVYARPEPKVGTRSPVKGNGGGAMSREAVLRALDDARAQPAQTSASTPPLVQVSDKLNPRARLAKQEADAGLKDGGAVRGPGGPREDKISAKLSNGEHVIDAESVTALGDGDNATGQAMLNEMREKVKAHFKSKKGARRG